VAGVGVNVEVLVDLAVGMRVSQSFVGRSALGLCVAGWLACRLRSTSPVEW
jgi:hypothetical protein